MTSRTYGQGQCDECGFRTRVELGEGEECPNCRDRRNYALDGGTDGQQ